MKILVITNSVPFPSRHGIELPIAQIFSRLAARHDVDLLVYGMSENDRAAFESRRGNIPDAIRSVGYVGVSTGSRLGEPLQELLLIRPSFLVRGELDAAGLGEIRSRSYDAIWISPLGGIGLLESLRGSGAGLGGKVVVGLNDAKYGLYANGFRHLLKRSPRDEWRRIMNAFRTPWILLFERRLLRRADAVHVQTALEKRRVDRIFLGMRRHPAVFVAQNGTGGGIEPSAPARVPRERPPVVLFMTHLARGRSAESRWFLKKVWPLVLRARPDAELWLVGSPPEDPRAVSAALGPNVIIKGYVAQLDACLSQAAVGVIPTLHNSGWVNRIGDYLRAGLPLVACREPLQTVSGLEPGKHALLADTPADFAKAVVELLDSPVLACTLSRNGLALASSFPTWPQTVSEVERQLLEISDNGV